MNPRIALIACLVVVGLLGIVAAVFPHAGTWSFYLSQMTLIFAIGVSSWAIAKLIYPLGSRADSSLIVAEIASEIHSMKVIVDRFPDCSIRTSTWSMRFTNLHVILELIDDLRPNLIIELGSGMSTVLIASWLRETGRGRLISFDHDRVWGGLTQRHLARVGLDAFAQVRCVPLTETISTNHSVLWYEFDQCDFHGESIDFVVVDGPPGNLSPNGMSRLPVVDSLGPFLSNECCIVLDDVNRKAERDILQIWQSQLPGSSLHTAMSSTGIGYILRTSSLNDVTSGKTMAEAY